MKNRANSRKVKVFALFDPLVSSFNAAKTKNVISDFFFMPFNPFLVNFPTFPLKPTENLSMFSRFSMFSGSIIWGNWSEMC